MPASVQSRRSSGSDADGSATGRRHAPMAVRVGETLHILQPAVYVLLIVAQRWLERGAPRRREAEVGQEAACALGHAAARRGRRPGARLPWLVAFALELIGHQLCATGCDASRRRAPRRTLAARRPAAASSARSASARMAARCATGGSSRALPRPPRRARRARPPRGGGAPAHKRRRRRRQHWRRPRRERPRAAAARRPSRAGAPPRWSSHARDRAVGALLPSEGSARLARRRPAWHEQAARARGGKDWAARSVVSQAPAPGVYDLVCVWVYLFSFLNTMNGGYDFIWQRSSGMGHTQRTCRDLPPS